MENLKVWDKEAQQIFDVAKINFETQEVSYVGSPSGYDVDALFEQVIFLHPMTIIEFLKKLNFGDAGEYITWDELHDNTKVDILKLIALKIDKQE